MNKLLLIGIGLIVIAILIKWFFRKKKSDIPYDDQRRAFTNQEKFLVAEKVVKEYGVLRCTKCGSKEELEVDHIIPLTHKGSHNGLSNLTLKCKKCNRSKGDRYEG